MAEKRITKINIDGEEYSVGDGGGGELEKYVRSTPGSEEGTSAQFGLVDEYNYIQIDRKIENNENDEHNLSVTLNDKELLKIKDTVTEGSKNNIAYELEVNNLAITSDTAHIEIGSGAGVADNSNAMAMGEDTVVTGQSSISLGQHNIVQGDNSFSLGENIELRGKNSLIIGQGSSEGSFSIDANNSFVLGTDIKAQKNKEPYYDNIFAIGKGIKCTDSNQTIIGKYNDSSEANKILVIGNGTAENNRSNLFSISNLGNVNINTQDFFQNSGNGFYQIIADISEKEHYTSGKWNSLFLLKDDIGKKVSYIDFKQSYYSNNASIREMKIGISAPNEDYTNNLTLGVNFSGKKTVELSDPDAWRSALVTDPMAWRNALFTNSIRQVKRIKQDAINLSSSSDNLGTIAEFNNLPKGIYLAIGKVLVEAIDKNGTAIAIPANSNARVEAHLFNISEFANQTLSGIYLANTGVNWNSINVCGITFVREDGDDIYLRAHAYVSDTTVKVKAWGTLSLLNLTNGAKQLTNVSS